MRLLRTSRPEVTDRGSVRDRPVNCIVVRIVSNTGSCKVGVQSQEGGSSVKGGVGRLGRAQPENSGLFTPEETLEAKAKTLVVQMGETEA